MNTRGYEPLQNGIEENISDYIDYSESKPHVDHSELVHCYWLLKNKSHLDQDFVYTVLPDGCIDIVFDVLHGREPIIMTPKTEVETINLGQAFRYIGVRFKPGVFSKQLNILEVVGSQQNLKDIISVRIPALKSAECSELDRVVKALVDAQILRRNAYIEHVIKDLQNGHKVSDIAKKLKVSERHLRRSVQKQTGFSPVQLRRVIRFQSILSSGEPLLRFADQSHLIKEFRAITGRSYSAYMASHVDVRKVQS